MPSLRPLTSINSDMWTCLGALAAVAVAPSSVSVRASSMRPLRRNATVPAALTSSRLPMSLISVASVHTRLTCMYLVGMLSTSR